MLKTKIKNILKKILFSINPLYRKIITIQEQIEDLKKIYPIKKDVIENIIGKNNEVQYNNSKFTDISFNIKGDDNFIQIYEFCIIKNTNFDIIGNNNKIIIENSCSFINSLFFIKGNNNNIYIKENVSFAGKVEFKITCNKGYIEIGKFTTGQLNNSFEISENDLKIVVGNDCMFSSNILVWTQDFHPIFNNKNERINNGKDVFINDHVWVGYDVKILKGVEIGKNNIIGTNTIVTKAFKEENVIIAGNPGRIIKTSVNWKRKMEKKKKSALRLTSGNSSPP